jgi:cytochrome c-type biogenesis protein
MTYVWAYLAGMLTLLNPCVLPLLPVILAAALQSSRFGPIMLTTGLTCSFTTVGVGVTAFGHGLGIDEETINRMAAVVMIVFGLVLFIPRAQALLAGLASPLASGADNRIERVRDAGPIGQFVVGILLGAVWSPCIGPTLGGAIGLAASGDGLVQAGFTMLIFGSGMSTVLMALAYASLELLGARQAKLAVWMPWAKPIMGGALLMVGVTIYFHFDRIVERWLLDLMPAWLQDLSVTL